MDTLLSCTVQQAAELDEALAVSAAPDAGVGLQPLNNSLTEYLSECFGAVMTDDCISQQTANRSFSRSAKLAKEYGSDIKLTELSLKKSSDSKEVYTFSATLSSGKEVVTDVSGTIRMEKSGSDWKAGRIDFN